MSDTHLLVSLDWQGQLHRIGHLEIHKNRGRENYRFIYERTWIKHPNRFAIDPELPLLVNMPYLSNRLWGAFQIFHRIVGVDWFRHVLPVSF